MLALAVIVGGVVLVRRAGNRPSPASSVDLPSTRPLPDRRPALGEGTDRKSGIRGRAPRDVDTPRAPAAPAAEAAGADPAPPTAGGDRGGARLVPTPSGGVRHPTEVEFDRGGPAPAAAPAARE